MLVLGMGPAALALHPQETLLAGPTAEVAPAAASPGTATVPASSLRLVAVPPEQSGLDFRHHSGRQGTAKTFMVECVGAGLGLLDADGDGDLDVWCVQGGTVEADGRTAPGPDGDVLFLNDGRARFARQARGDLGRGFGFGVVAGDVDGDGDADAFVACLGPNRLLLNDGDGTFAPAPDAGGAAGSGDDWSMCGAFGDPDGDGDLDLYVSNYLHHDLAHPMIASGRPCRWLGCEVPCGPKGLDPQQDRFYLNDGQGAFREATHEAGFDAAPPSYAFQAVWTDVDVDGDPDLFVANDSVPNSLWLHQGPVAAGGTPRFVEAGLMAGVALSDTGKEQAGMGVAVGDADGDGLLDLVMTNYSQEQNALFRNAGGGPLGAVFFDDGGTSGLGWPSYFDLGWGASFLDVDLDGDLDLFVANGHVYPQVDGCGIANTTYREANRLFVQDRPGHFAPATGPVEAGLGPAKSSRGCVAGDLDGDGDADLVVSNLDDAPDLLLNETPHAGGWMRLLLTPPARAVGARVEWRAGARRLVFETRAGSSFLGCEDPGVLVALPGEGGAALGAGAVDGADATSAAGARVRWSDGRVELFEGLAPGRTNRLAYGTGRP